MKVACGILILNDSVLVGKRKSDNKDYPGYWEFPGGKVDLGESKWNALKREWVEELDVNIHPFHELRTLYDGDIEFTTYTVRLESGKAKLIEHDEVRFVNRIKFNKMHLTPLTKEAGQIFFGSYSIFLNQEE